MASEPTKAPGTPGVLKAVGGRSIGVGPQPTTEADKPKLFSVRKPVRKERYLKVLVYGDYGVGKTHLLATCDEVPQMQDVLFIDAESGDLTLQSRPHLDVVTVSSYKQFAKVYEWLKLHARFRDAAVAGDDEAISRLKELQDRLDIDEPDRLRAYRTVVIDSLSEIQRYNMYQLLGVEIGRRALDLEPEQAEFKEWGQTTDMIRLAVRSFRDLPMHFLVAMSEKASNRKLEHGPSTLNVPTKLSEDLPGFFDVVGALEAKKTEGGASTPGASKDGMARVLIMSPVKSYLGVKNRFPNFTQGVMQDPSMRKLYALVEEPQ